MRGAPRTEPARTRRYSRSQMKVKAPTIHTERLILRPPDPSDAEALFAAYASDPEVTRFLRWTPKTHPDELRDFLRGAQEISARGEELHWVLEVRESHSPAGILTVWYGEHGAELGFALSRALWGRGYMTEAGSAIIGWVLRDGAIYRVWAYCDCENEASIRVLEKLGLEKEGRLRRWAIHPNVSDEPRDVFVFSLVR